MGWGILLLFVANTASALTVGLLPFKNSPHDYSQNVKVKYRMRINKNDTTVINNKIIFIHSAAFNPGVNGMYPVGTNFYSNLNYKYADVPNLCQDWPPVPNSGSSFIVATADYTPDVKAFIGFKSLDTAMFPRLNAGIDGNKSPNGMRAASQMNVDGKDILVEDSLDETFTTPLDGWMSRWLSASSSCDPLLPDGHTYRIIKQVVTIGGNIYNFQYAFDSNIAKYLDAPNPRTEFLNNPGLFQAYVWDVQVMPSGSTSWVVLNKWELKENNTPEENNAGARHGSYNGTPVLELSNNNPSYVKTVGSVIDLNQPMPTPFPTPIPTPVPNPVVIKSFKNESGLTMHKKEKSKMTLKLSSPGSIELDRVLFYVDGVVTCDMAAQQLMTFSCKWQASSKAKKQLIKAQVIDEVNNETDSEVLTVNVK